MLHEVAHLLGVALGAKPGVELPGQLIHVVADVVNLSMGNGGNWYDFKNAVGAVYGGTLCPWF